MEAKAVTSEHIRLMQHCIGLNYKKPKRGKYEAYRNYFQCTAPHVLWEHVVSIGYATVSVEERDDYIPKKSYYYSLTRDGLDFMGIVIGCKITEMR